MRLAIGSLWRNSAHNVPAYYERIVKLRMMAPQLDIRVIACEGDSTDNTLDALLTAGEYYGVPTEVRIHNHGGPVFGSTEAPERMVALSGCFNALLEAVRAEDELFLYVENDLLWHPGSILEVLLAVVREYTHVAAPRVMAHDVFYDIWGFRGLDGERFSPFAPYHPSCLTPNEFGLVEVSSVGSCLAMHGTLAQQVRIKNDYAIVGWCEEARKLGARIHYVPTAEVRQV